MGLGAAPAKAQVSKGSISGNIADQQGAAVPDAAVVAVSKDTNQQFNASSDNSGLFKLSLLPVGSLSTGDYKEWLSQVRVRQRGSYGWRGPRYGND